MLAAITTWTRRDVRRGWRGLAMLSVAVAVGVSFTMLAAVGARRTSSAWSRFESGQSPPDVIGEVPIADLATRLTEISTMPGVTDVAAFSYMSVTYEGYEPASGWQLLGGFAGISPAFLRTVYRPKVVEGRALDPDRIDEVSINESAAAITGLRPGDRIVLTSDPAVVRQEVTVVGIHRGVLDVGLNGDQPSVLMTPAFGARWFTPYLDALPDELAAGYTGAVFAKVPDPTDRQPLLRLGFGERDAVGVQITSGLDTQSTSFSVLTALSGIGVLAAAGQAVSRRVRRGADHVATLAALGLAPAGRRVAVASSAASAAVVGSLAAPWIAIAASPLASTGLQRQLESHRAIVVDGPVLVLGALVSSLVLVAVAGTAAARADRVRLAGQPRPRTPRIVLPGAAGLFGGRVASGWASASGRIVARAHVVAVAVALAATTAVGVWSSAARHVVATPAAYGQTWDALVAPPDDSEFLDPAAVEAARARLLEAPDVGATIGRLVAGMAAEEGVPIEVLEVDRQAGTWWPGITRGRVPVARDEVTIGEGLAQRGGKRIGDNLVIGDRTLTIVGEHVAPQFSNGDYGLAVAIPASDADLDLRIPVAYLVVDLAPGVTIDRLQAVIGEGAIALPTVSPTGAPGPVANLGRIGAIDELLIALCALLAVATFANGLILATSARRRDHATLRALGGVRRMIGATVGWHTGIVVASGLAIGVPVGLLVGRAVWRGTASGIYVGPGATHAPLVAATVAAASCLGAAAVAALTARSASLAAPALADE